MSGPHYVVEGLEKFPVITEHGEYKVTIESNPVALGLRYWQVKIYKENKNPRMFQKRFKLIGTYDTGWSTYMERSENLVGLAKEAVKDYEHRMAEKLRHKKALDQSVTEFEKWDGRI